MLLVRVTYGTTTLKPDQYYWNVLKKILNASELVIKSCTIDTHSFISIFHKQFISLFYLYRKSGAYCTLWPCSIGIPTLNRFYRLVDIASGNYATQLAITINNSSSIQYC